MRRADFPSARYQTSVLSSVPPMIKTLPRWRALASRFLSAVCLVSLGASSLLQTAQAARDPWAWPFASDSIWNTPIGDAANYVDSGLRDATFATTDHEYLIRLMEKDPVTNLEFPGGGSLWFFSTMKVPYYFYSPSWVGGSNYCASFLQTDGRRLIEFQPTTRSSYGSSMQGYVIGHSDDNTDNSLFGNGRKGSHFGSSMSTLGGSIRLGELTGSQPIRHVLKLILSERFMHSGTLAGEGGTGQGWRWPAYTADGYVATGYTSSNTQMGMGTLLAIPKGITDPASLGITTAVGRKMFYALRNYGAYIVDTCGVWSQNDDFPQQVPVEKGVAEEVQDFYGTSLTGGFENPIPADINRLVKALKVVANNSPANKGGPGNRLTSTAPAINAEIGELSNGDYSIKAYNTNKALDGYGTGNGAAIGLWDSHSGENQKWTLTKAGNGFYKIKNKASGRLLDITGTSMTDGARAQQADDANGDNQLYTLLPSDDGYYRIQARHSHSVLDVPSGNFSNGVLAEQRHFNGSNAQKWKITSPSGGTGSALLENNAIYEIEPSHTAGKRLDVNGVSTSDGANVHIWDDFSAGNQRWKAIDVGGGYHAFEPQHAPGKRLDVNGGGSSDGSNVHSWSGNSSAAQRWKAIDVGGGLLELEPQCAPGKRLDVSSGGTGNGTNVQIWSSNSSGPQRWRFLKQ